MAKADRSFVDTFDDGSHVDDSLVTWAPYASPLDQGRLASGKECERSIGAAGRAATSIGPARTGSVELELDES
jgi:hypothetical protein